MTHLALSPWRLSLVLTLIATCAIITESSMIRERRHIEDSSRSSKEHTSYSQGTKLPSSTSPNKITAEPGRKVSHHLIGGHLKVDTKLRGDGESLWDDGILMSAAGSGKEGKSNRGGDGGGSDDEDGKKTLSQQVKEGKYGLIQNEIYGNRPKRPGIISYLDNPEVPKDTIDNLGGLDEDEIWLAENHVLVLRGGKFPEHAQEGGQQQSGDGEQPKWPPIDDYKAPKRQVKIPPRPKVPPPFPVQLTEGGPVQIIGPNGTVEEISNGTLDYNTLYTKGLLPGEDPFFSIAPNGTVFTPDFGLPGNFSVEEKSFRGNNDQKGIKPELPHPPTGALPPFYHAIPPGAIFVPPPGNQSDYDEEDQSIYYPPPYSFYYPQDNTTAVPPGPLVPGIILPPPPDFFSALDDKKTTTKKYTKRPTTTSSPETRPTYLPPRKFTIKQNKASSISPSLITKTSTTSSTSTKVSFGRTTVKNATNIFKSKKITSNVDVTTSTPGKPHTLENTEIYTISPVIGNQVSEATNQQKDWSTLVTSKIPVLAYYPSTTQSSLERPVEVTPASIKTIITTSQPDRSASHASYYFYEESTDENSDVTEKPSPVYYESTTKSPYYNVETSRSEQKKNYYETIPPVETSKNYKAKLIDNIVKNSQTYQYTDNSETTSTKFDASSSRDQGQRMLADQAPIYYQPVPARPVQTYYTTPKPQTYYRQTTKPKPIYQYSFQIADYSKLDNQRSPYHGEQQQQQQQQQQQDSVYSEYQDIKTGNRQYDYEDIDSPSRHQSRKQVYKTQHPVYSTSTSYPIVDTTPNPQYAYFTQQDEKLLDDVTKEYFTIFGKKLPDTRISTTTPIYGKSSSVTEKPDHNANAYLPNVYKTGRPVTYNTLNVKVRYGDQSQRPYSLKDDTLVNYRRPLPPINPDSEFVEIIDPKHRSKQPSQLPNYELQTGNYRLQNQGVQQPTPRYRLRGTIQPANRHTNNFVPFSESREELENVQEPVSLLDDIEVNYRNPRPPINPDAEFIDPITVQDNHSNNPNAYFAYRLPGDVGHFYFLTPQAITQRQDQNSGYVYPKPRGPRLRRRPG
ncbi:PREDICTED: uncharacterized protein LOC108750658 [Trachymyrmex septentrionalis]|uniref:uncharacterized protein LOC108750658 n=1 Tax=Trachymyrmex septentrionalis TaxID=34720 RepID=UPI00084F659D|nr:PREDICTED: uncharacterized protein LOC108750658 [Trachymyrmex septentrionalis]XP_018345796.1 PREDICTED: uncharacterized protein LOC108750658 [Trachymyrmex septentrionalis]